MTCKASFTTTLEPNLINQNKKNIITYISGSLAKLANLHVSCWHVDCRLYSPDARFNLINLVCHLIETNIFMLKWNPIPSTPLHLFPAKSSQFFFVCVKTSNKPSQSQIALTEAHLTVKFSSRHVLVIV